MTPRAQFDPTLLTADDIAALRDARRDAGNMGNPLVVDEADPSWWHLDKAVREVIAKAWVGGGGRHTPALDAEGV